MKSIAPTNAHFEESTGKTVIITGAAGGIGAATAMLYHKHGAKVVLADLEQMRSSAERVVASLLEPARATFIPVNTTNWGEMTKLFRSTKEKFGGVDIVVANAGVMESSSVLESAEVDENGDLKEPTEAYIVIDTNLKGTLNTLRLALFHMAQNKPQFSDGSRGSVILNISTSGYFGGTGAAAYISSKHGVTGLLRGSQLAARRANVRVNAIAPNFTTTRLTMGLSKQWHEAGIDYNTPEKVAHMIVQMSVDPARRGDCCLVCGHILRELEHTRNKLLPEWLGADQVQFMDQVETFIAGLGGLKVPKFTETTQESKNAFLCGPVQAGV